MKPFISRTVSLLMTIVMLISIVLPVIALGVETETTPASEQVVEVGDSGANQVPESTGISSDDSEEQVPEATNATKMATEAVEEEAAEKATEVATEPTEEVTEEYNSTQAPDGYVARNEILEIPSVSVMALDEDDLPKVLLIEDVLPWNSTANQEVLSGITEFDKTTTTDFLNVELENYGVVVFANDQPFDTYQNYEEFKEYLELFASLGGVIVFGACDAGWADGSLNEMLPGNVSKKTHYVETNYVADNGHMIVTGSLTDNTVLTDDALVSNYCSHVSFDEETLPAGSKVILRESATNRPTLIEYPLGEGRVIASGLTWEHNYVYGGTNGRGEFAAVAMEDMFRYAIRVSSIDVDELHVLEEWRVAKKAHAIIVADGSGNKDDLNPIAGAKVVIDGTEYITNEDGVVTTTDYGEKIVEVSAEGYRECKEYYELKEQTSRIFLMEKDKNDGLPYITLCTAAKNSKAPYVDLRTQALHYTENKGAMLLLWLQGNWNGHGEGKFHVFQEAANGQPGKVFEIPVGNYLNIAPGNIFEPNAQIKVQMVAADGTKSEIVDLNIEIDKAPPEPGETSDTAIKEGVTEFDWLGKYPIASDDEVFTKLLTSDMSFAGDLIPVEIAKNHNEDGSITYKGAIGILASEDSKELMDGDDNDEFEMESAWDEFKDQIEGYKNAKNPKQYFKNLSNKYKELFVPSKLESTVDVEVKVCGYFEVTVNNNNEVIKSDGGLIVNGGASAVIGKTFLAGPVPVYFEFKPGVEAEVSAGITFYNETDALTFKPFFNGIDLAIPSISLEGGVGVRGVATAGLNGTGKLLVALPGTDDPQTNVDLTLDGSVHIKVILVADYNWPFAGTKIHFYPKENAANVLAVAMEEMKPEVSLASRDYLVNTTEWNGAAVSQMAEEEIDNASVLQEGVMPEAMPQLHQIGDRQIVLFLRDVQERTIGNHTQLVYSVCQDGVWSEPQPVWESESADFFFSSAVVNDNLVVAWQKSSDITVSENVENLLAEVAANSEICFASWDAETGAFSNQMYVTDNDLVDMMPAVATDGENVTVSWVRNDANNVLGIGGNYEIYQTSITSNGAQLEQMLYTTEDYIIEIASGMGEDGTHLIFSAMNDDNSVDLYSLGGNEATMLVSSENPAGLSYADGMFLWQKDGSIFSYIPGAAEAETLISSDVASISSSYEYITNGAGASVVWTDGNENGYQVNASIRTNKSWSGPVSLMSGQDDTVPFMDAVMLDDGNYSIILNTACYDDEENLAQATLSYANIAPKTCVSVELAELNYPDWENSTQEINIALENSGSVPVYNATVTVSCERGTLLDKTLDLELMPGDSVIITEVMDILSVNKEMAGVVDVQIANDIDESDNTMTVNLGEVDASLDLDVYETGDEFLFVLTASNNSNTDANAALSITEDSLDGIVLNMKNIGVVTNAENVQYLFAIDRSKIDFAGKETKTYFFSLSTLESDWYDSDNILTYTIKAPSNIESDPDGEMEIIEMVLPERVEITEESLHFSSLEDESVQLHATVYPEEASDRAVYWSAEDNDIIHITEDGIVTPLREGTTTITAMVPDGIKDTIVVTVVVEAETHVHTITFDANGGCLDQGSAETNEGGTLNSLPKPVRDGYVFLGWFTEVSGGVQVTTDTMFTNDATIYAHWEENDNREDTEPVDPTDPSTPEEPADPSEPTDPEGSDDSVDPSNPSEPEDSADPTDPDEDEYPATSPDSDKPQTGDDSNISLYIAIMIASVICLMIFAFILVKIKYTSKFSR